jgi:hypothetical protein
VANIAAKRSPRRPGRRGGVAGGEVVSGVSLVRQGDHKASRSDVTFILVRSTTI